MPSVGASAAGLLLGSAHLLLGLVLLLQLCLWLSALLGLVGVLEVQQLFTISVPRQKACIISISGLQQ